MYVVHDLFNVRIGKTPLYLCNECHMYYELFEVKNRGWRYSKRTRMGRKKIPRMAHVAGAGRWSF